MAGAAVALATIWLFRGTQRQDKNLESLGVVLITSGLLMLWVLLLSRLRWKVRLLTLVGVVGVCGLLRATLKITGVTGDLIPVIEWRWRVRDELAEFELTDAASRSPTAASPIGNRPVLNFPQFGGPNRDGKLNGPILARDWDAEPPEQLWRRQVGGGWSGFATVGEFAVTMEQRGPHEHITCYQLRTGDPVWSHSYEALYESTVAGNGPRTVPTIDDSRVYAIGSTGVLSCLDLETGQCIWTKDILEEHQRPVPEWGFSASPLVVDDKVIVNPGGKDGASLAAYGSADGKMMWGGGEDSAHYASPVLTSLDGVRQVVMFNRTRIVGHSLENGRVLWDLQWIAPGHPNVSLPVVLPDNRILASAGYGEGSMLFRVQHDADDKWSAAAIWQSNRLKSKFANLIVIDNFVYGLDDGILVCLDLATGDRMWKRGRYGHGQMILVGSLLLIMSEKGDVVLVDPNPEEHRELTRFTAFGTKTWNPPALAGEYLLVRNDREAACFRLPTK